MAEAPAPRCRFSCPAREPSGALAAAATAAVAAAAVVAAAAAVFALTLGGPTAADLPFLGFWYSYVSPSSSPGEFAPYVILFPPRLGVKNWLSGSVGIFLDNRRGRR